MKRNIIIKKRTAENENFLLIRIQQENLILPTNAKHESSRLKQKRIFSKGEKMLHIDETHKHWAII